MTLCSPQYRIAYTREPNRTSPSLSLSLSLTLDAFSSPSFLSLWSLSLSVSCFTCHISLSLSLPLSLQNYSLYSLDTSGDSISRFPFFFVPFFSFFFHAAPANISAKPGLICGKARPDIATAYCQLLFSVRVITWGWPIAERIDATQGGWPNKDRR